jgi:hypothetical protein
MAPRDTDVVQPKVRLREALHRRLIAAARANKATLNGEIVRRLEESFVHEALEKRLASTDPPSNFDRTLIMAFEERMRQMGVSMERLATLLEGNVLTQSSPDGSLHIMVRQRQGQVRVVDAPRPKRKRLTQEE